MTGVLQRELAVRLADGEETSVRVAGCVGRAGQPLGQGGVLACVDPEQLVDGGEVQVEVLRRDACLGRATARAVTWSSRPSAAVSLVGASISSPRTRPPWRVAATGCGWFGSKIGWHLDLNRQMCVDRRPHTVV
jgi:hypothetical protein